MKTAFKSILMTYALSAMFSYGVEVQTSGETRYTSELNKYAVEVKLLTQEIDIEKPGDGSKKTKIAACTYSKYPCSLVNHLDIVVNKSSIFVPRSVYQGLSDIYFLDVQCVKKNLILVLKGGDASEAYVVKIFFDSERIQKKELYSALDSEHVIEETFYYEQGETLD